MPDPEDSEDLARRMLMWRLNIDYWRQRVSEFAQGLRTYSWQDMAEQFYCLANGIPAGITESVE